MCLHMLHSRQLHGLVSMLAFWPVDANDRHPYSKVICMGSMYLVSKCHLITMQPTLEFRSQLAEMPCNPCTACATLCYIVLWFFVCGDDVAMEIDDRILQATKLLDREVCCNNKMPAAAG